MSRKAEKMKKKDSLMICLKNYKSIKMQKSFNFMNTLWMEN